VLLFYLANGVEDPTPPSLQVGKKALRAVQRCSYRGHDQHSGRSDQGVILRLTLDWEQAATAELGATSPIQGFLPFTGSDPWRKSLSGRSGTLFGADSPKESPAGMSGEAFFSTRIQARGAPLGHHPHSLYPQTWHFMHPSS